jgi:hypothetical protein
LPDGKKEEWGWIDEHIERPAPEVAGDEVRIIGKGSTHPDQDAAEQEGDEEQTDTDASTTPPNEGA